MIPRRLLGLLPLLPIPLVQAEEANPNPRVSLLGDYNMEPKTFDSLADGFKVSLVRPPTEAKNSGQKSIVDSSSIYMLDEAEQKALDDYDELFEKYSMFCNGRYLGVQVLQDSQDLQYISHIVYMKKPDVIIETGTYKGGLTFVFAHLLDTIAREEMERGMPDRATKVLTVDKHHPDLVFAANWFCPPCLDCRRSYQTREWIERVKFIQGLADEDETQRQILHAMADLGFNFDWDSKPRGEGYYLLIQPDQKKADGTTLEECCRNEPDPSGKVVVVNLDANHEYNGLLMELILYGPLVTLNSYLIVQDAKLDRIWGVPAVSSAVLRFLHLIPRGEFVVENEVKFHGYSQHIYLRRAKKSFGFDYFVNLFAEMAKEADEKNAKKAEKPNSDL